jgi:AcrR family transcriptional regulator
MAQAPAIDPAVVEAAARVLVRDGLAGTTIVAVAAEAGCSRVTLHRHGVTRAELVDAVVRRAADDVRASLWPALTGPGPAATRFVTALEELCDVAERHRGVLAALFSAKDPPRAERRGRRSGFDFIEPFERLLLDGLVDGSLRSDEPELDAELAVNAVTWTYIHLRSAHGWSRTTARARVVAMAVAGLLPA